VPLRRNDKERVLSLLNEVIARALQQGISAAEIRACIENAISSTR